jgi:glutamate-1-semialdehyde 2,1-aminomutase
MTMPGEYIVADYNSIASVEEELSRVPADSLAAILIEPMQGAGGCLPASIEFLQHLRARATELKALLIFDEVMTSRLHHAGGLSGKYGIKPDLITMGKYLGGGMSFGLFGGRREIMEMFNPKSGGVVTTADGTEKPMSLVHSGTFNNNVVTMHAGIAGTKILTEAVLTQLNELGDYLRQAVLSILVGKGLVEAATDADMRDIATVPRGRIWISGIGSINAVHFGVNDELVDLRDLFYFHMIKKHIYVTRRGFVALSIVHTRDDIDRYVKSVASFVDRWGSA